MNLKKSTLLLFSCLILIATFPVYAKERRNPPLFVKGWNGIDVSKVMHTKDSTSYNLPSVTEIDKNLFYAINHVNPFQLIKHTAKYNNKILFEAVYDIGEFGLRVTKSDTYSKKATSHLIVAGDSNVFGIGVKDSDTLPSMIALAGPRFHPYNFGISGSGPHNTLALMEFFPWSNDIREPEGYFIYNYYDFLMERMIGSKSYISWNDGLAPHYELNSEGVPEYQGLFEERFLTKVYNYISAHPWLDKLLPVLPRHRHYHTELAAKMFVRMQEIYKSVFPKGHFIVAINYMFPEVKPGTLKELAEELEKNHIQTIIIPAGDYKYDYKLPDGHLSEFGHRLEADVILKHLPQ